MDGWQRGMYFDETGLPWVPTSPGIPHLSTAIVYPGACFIEGANLSEGRGTTRPFELFGAPFIDGRHLAGQLAEIVEILDGREVAVEHDVLRDERDVPLGLERILGHVNALDEGRARRRRLVGQRLDHCDRRLGQYPLADQ
jgi:hypothetical protein